MPKPTFVQLPNRTKRKIYQTCVKLLAANGYNRTTIKMITRRMKVADGYLHYYFSGKADMIAWVIETGLDQWIAHHRRHVDSHKADNVFELVKLIILQQVRFTRDHREVFAAYRMVVNEPKFPLLSYLFDKISAVDKLVADAIAASARDGHLRPGTSPELVAMLMDLLITRIQEFAYDSSYDPLGVSQMNEAQVIDLIDRILALLRDGIGPLEPGDKRL